MHRDFWAICLSLPFPMCHVIYISLLSTHLSLSGKGLLAVVFLISKSLWTSFSAFDVNISSMAIKYS